LHEGDQRVVQVHNLEPTVVKPTRRRSDSSLIAGCRNGDEEAWSVLLDRYKNLIFSIPVNHGFSQTDARDIFQAVSLDLLTELPRLRNTEALPKWLIQTTMRKCWRWKRREQQYGPEDVAEPDVFGQGTPPPATPEDVLQELQRDQVLRDAIVGLSPRCRQIIRMLFYETPARPYSEVAMTLGVATGSIGFLRRRCLRGLRRQLKRSGFERGTGRSGRDPDHADG
jgi:RNA polymerase sigma factor (sigma-70 family)